MYKWLLKYHLYYDYKIMDFVYVCNTRYMIPNMIPIMCSYCFFYFDLF